MARPRARLGRLSSSLLSVLLFSVRDVKFSLSVFYFLIFSRASIAFATGANGLLLDAVLVKNDLIAIGERGVIIHSIDSGKSWENVPSPTVSTLTSIAFSDDQLGWIVGHDGTILITRDGGATWTPQFNAKNKEVSFLSVAIMDAHRVFAVGSFGAFFSTSDGGYTWTEQKVIDDDPHLNGVIAVDHTQLYVAGEHGTLLRFADLGRHPTAIAPPYDGSFFGVLSLGGHERLAYGLRSHFYRSEDEGDHWQAVPAEPSALIATVVRLKSGTLVAAGQARVFFVSLDAGHTFSAWKTPLTTAVSQLVEAPDGSLVAFGEAGATRLVSPDSK
jgi:photosystem II stability/assembly factor-like uncharacterized protein